MINDLDNGKLISRLHKTSCPCCEESVPACNFLFHPCRKAVSGHKVRYQKDGFDLDLTYLGKDKRIIVHGFPSVGIEHIYRNPRFELRRFLDERHRDHYKVYNFCCEPGRGYPAENFHGRVERYPFKDHNTPPLDTMIAFAESAKKWMDEDSQNICSNHCKAGKGRAGLMSCILLVRSGICQTAVQALDLYDATRVNNNRGLTVTSQRKYVLFFEAIWRQYYGVLGDIGAVPGADPGKRLAPKQPELYITGVEVKGCKLNLRKVRIMIYKGSNMAPELLYDSHGHNESDETTAFSCEGTTVQGNFKVHVEHKPGVFSKKQKIFELWHNTLFIDRHSAVVDFMADQLDIKRKLKAQLGEKICLRLRFSKTKSASGSTTKSASGQAAYEMISTKDGDEEEAVSDRV
eukprot:GSChrysophyteH1.ASY1.ANO1.1773.1 assembled CDS